MNDRKEIHSIKDPNILLARELTSREGRLLHKKFLLYGKEQIQWAEQSGVKIECILCKKSDLISFSNSTIYETSEGILKKATETSYLISPIAIAAVPSLLGVDSDLVVVLDRVCDFGNIGTIIRTAKSFGLSHFISTQNDFDPFQRKVIDSSRGSVFSSSFQNKPSDRETIDYLKAKGYQLVVTSPHAKTLQSQVQLQKRPVALVIGNESDGVSETFMKEADLCIQIPQFPGVESLNVGVAAGISMYELKFKMVLLMLREKIFDNLGRTVNVTGKMIQQAFDRRIQKASYLNGMQVILLMILHCDQKMTVEEISRDVGLFGDELENFLKPFLQQELLSIKDTQYEITDKGKNYLAEIWPVVEETNERLLEGFSITERKELHTLLQRLQDNCEKIF